MGKVFYAGDFGFDHSICVVLHNDKIEKLMKQSKISRTPCQKRMKQESRLHSARDTGWVTKYRGGNIIKGYSKWFGVGLLTAITELRMLGILIDAAREAEVRASIESRTEARRRHREALAQKRVNELCSDTDDTFAYIAGYTAGGVPYGVTWEELGEEPPWLTEEENIEPCC